MKQLSAILDDPEASDNDRFVAYDMLKNANISAGGILPMCQDTGTAIIMGKKGQNVWTGGGDEAALARGVHRTYTETNLRYSQVSPVSMYERPTLARTSRRRLRSMPKMATPINSCFLPRVADRRTRAFSTRRLRRG